MHPKSFVLGLAAVLALGACGKKDAPALLAAPGPGAQPPTYLPLPQVLAVSGRPGGNIQIQGAAAADSRIRGETPDHTRYGATADKSGRFALDVPPAKAPELILVSEENGRRELQTDGWLFVPPDAPDRSVMLRAGAATRPFQGDLIAAIDFDAAGGATVSGVTTPGAAVDVSVDGGTVMHAVADTHGVWDARLDVEKHITPGSHQLRVASHGSVVDRAFDFSVGALGAGQLFNPVREADGWRIAWQPYGGGVQTTLLLVGASRS